MTTPTSFFPWRVQLRPEHPEPLRKPPWLAVVEPLSRGMWMLDHMLAEGLHVGPVTACSVHDRVRIPVALDAVHSLLTTRLTLTDRLECGDAPYRRHGCPARIWMLPPKWTDGDNPLTDVRGLFYAVNYVRRSAVA